VFDHISHHSRPVATQLGSPCLYTSLSARALGASVVVGSKVGNDLSKEQLRPLYRAGVNTNYIRRVEGRTTSFRIDYENGVRRMWTISRCPSLTREDVATLPPSKCLHLGPILSEIPNNVAMWLANRVEVSCLDAQGYLRKTLPDGRVQRVGWHDRRLLARLDVLKLSANEAALLLGEKPSQRRFSKLGPKVVLVTRAGAGTTVWSEEEGLFNVPAFETQVRDATGSGDALVGGMLVTWARTNDLLWSVAVGSAVASFVVERVRAKKFGTPRQIQKRANTLLNSSSS